MPDLSPIRSLTDSEVTRELLSLYDEAGPVERRILLMCLRGHDCGTKSAPETLAKLRDFMGVAPWDERRLQLYVARRLVAEGQRRYGRIDLGTERREMGVEAIAEDADSVVYRCIELLQGKSDGAMLDRSMAIMRDAIGEALRGGLI